MEEKVGEGEAASSAPGGSAGMKKEITPEELIGLMEGTGASNDLSVVFCFNSLNDFMRARAGDDDVFRENLARGSGFTRDQMDHYFRQMIRDIVTEAGAVPRRDDLMHWASSLHLNPHEFIQRIIMIGELERALRDKKVLAKIPSIIQTRAGFRKISMGPSFANEQNSTDGGRRAGSEQPIHLLLSCGSLFPRRGASSGVCSKFKY